MTLQTARVRTTARQSDLRLFAAMLGLLFIAGPALTAISSDLGDMAAAGATLFAFPVILSRISAAPRILWSVVVFVVAYTISAIATGDGGRHVLTTLTAATALMVFATYGKEMVEYRWFRVLAYLLILGGFGAVAAAGLPKNVTGGAILYLGALLVAILIANGARPGRLVFIFTAVAAAAAVVLDFRGLLGFTVVLALGYIGARVLPKRLFWFVGIVGSVTVIWATVWYFVNVQTNELAHSIAQYVVDASGRPATSGRDWLWPTIINTVEQYGPWFGLGAGTLPRDIMPTELSAHSTYMQTYLQLGIIGIAILALLLLAVWRPLAFTSNPAGQFGAAVFLMFVTHNATEVLMFQNGLIAAVPAWCAIGLAISASRVTLSRHTPG